MTEFERWRLARQEAEQLLQHLREAPHGDRPCHQPHDARGTQAYVGLGGHALAMRSAALRLLRYGAR